MTTNKYDGSGCDQIHPDYNDDKLGKPGIYQILDGGMRTSKPVGVSSRKSIKFFMVEMVDRLEVVREATAGGWTAARRFRELKAYIVHKRNHSDKRLPTHKPKILSLK